MHRLKLDSRSCVSCGICMDVCRLQAMTMREFAAPRIEGQVYSYLELRWFTSEERLPVTVGMFPYLALPEQCDGCQQCVRQCPVHALELKTSDLSKSNVLGHHGKENVLNNAIHHQP